jgi:hypothetical protein
MMADEDTQWSFSELYNLPIVLRTFFREQQIERYKEKKERADNAKGGGKTSGTGAPPPGYS